MQLTHILASGSLFASAALAAVHTVKVGDNGDNFNPNSLQADVGDVVQFVFSSAVCPSRPPPLAVAINCRDERHAMGLIRIRILTDTHSRPSRLFKAMFAKLWWLLFWVCTGMCP
jgi:hypothetical protein